MKTILIVAIIFLIPVLSNIVRNIYRYKKNLPFENTFIGRTLGNIIKK